MYVRIPYLILFLCCAVLVEAQLSDSIRVLLDKEPKLTFRLDGRGSFISNESVRMLGIKVGLDHGGRLQYGLGYNFLRSKFERERLIEEGGITSLRNTRLHLRMITPWLDYAFFRKGPWQVSIPVQIGIGSGHLSYENDESDRVKTDQTFLIVYEPAMTVQYRFLRYFGVAGGLGYRLAFKRREGLGESLTAPIYLLGFKVFFADIIKDAGYGPDLE